MVSQSKPSLVVHLLPCAHPQRLTSPAVGASGWEERFKQSIPIVPKIILACVSLFTVQGNAAGVWGQGWAARQASRGLGAEALPWEPLSPQFWHCHTLGTLAFSDYPPALFPTLGMAPLRKQPSLGGASLLPSASQKIEKVFHPRSKSIC